MGIEVGGDGDLGVPEAFGHDFEVDAGCQGDAGVGVAQVVQADEREAGSGGQVVEVSGDVFGPETGPVFPGEDEAALRPGVTPFMALGRLRRLVLPKVLDGCPVDLDDAGASSRLGGANQDRPFTSTTCCTTKRRWASSSRSPTGGRQPHRAASPSRE